MRGTGRSWFAEIGGSRRRTVSSRAGVLALLLSAAAVAGVAAPAVAATRTLAPEFPCSANPLPPYSPPTQQAHRLPPLPLSANGNHIETRTGQAFKLAAVNWYGAEGADYVPSGLDQLPVTAIAARIRALGFNAVRLPWSNEMVECNPTITAPALVAANPGLLDRTAVGVFDAVVNAIAAQGLLVILDNHMTDAEWCCDATDNNELWWSSSANSCSGSSGCDPAAGTAHWDADWITLVTRYAVTPAVAGEDLRNQPRTYAQWPGASNSPGSCPTGGACDWHASATALGNMLIGAVPHPGLVFVEGIDYGVNLTGAYSNPVTLQSSGHLVYEPHAYSFSDYCHPQVDSQCTSSSPWSPVSNWTAVSQTAFDDSLDSQWGFLSEQGTAPVWLGEFGTGQPCAPSSWFQLMQRYLVTTNFDWSYWALNGTQENSGAAPGTVNYQQQHRPLSLLTPETYGVLNTSWAGPSKHALLSVLSGLQKNPATAPGACVADPPLRVTDVSASRATAKSLANDLAGSGVTVSNAQLVGAPDAAGTFGGGQDSVNIAAGVVLSSGDAASAAGTTTSTAVSTDNGTPGDDALLSPYVGGLATHDAAELTFDFVPAGSTISVGYAFGSAEYDAAINSQYDDVAAIVVNGQDCAHVPGSTDPVTVNTLNDSTLEASSDAAHSELAVANDPTAWAVGGYGTALHGVGLPFTCTAAVNAGAVNHMIVAVADVSDALVDSDLFVQRNSLVSPGVGAPASATTGSPHGLRRLAAR